MACKCGVASAAQMTVAEATEIADNALEHSVRCILQAVQVRHVRLPVSLPHVPQA